MSIGLPLAIAPLLAAVVSMAVVATQMFERDYADTLCRIESVRTHALENIENDEPLQVDFGGETCATATTVGGTETATPGPEATPTALEMELAGAFLDLQDLPTGWTLGQHDAGGSGELAFCNVGSQIAPVATVEAAFQQSDVGPFLGHVVQAFSEGDALQAMAEARAEAQNCGEWVETDADGSQTTWRVSPMSFPSFGDETLALRLSADLQPFGALTMDLVFVRRGDRIAGVAYSVWGVAIDSTQTESFVLLADAKLAALP